MKTLFTNYVMAILVLFFFKIVFIDQVRTGFRGIASEAKPYESSEERRANLSLPPMR